MEVTKKFTYIDSIRGYAALMVLATHVYAFVCNSDKDIILSNFLVQCRMGVMLFFMISAVTLFLSLESKKDKEHYPIKNFFIRRFFRIAPLFYAVACFNLVFYKFEFFNILTTLTFTNGFFPSVMMTEIVRNGWTIAVEMVFYIILPFFFKGIKNSIQALTFFVVAIVFSVGAKYLILHTLNTVNLHSEMTEYTYYWLPAQLPVFALGIIIYFFLFKTDFLTATEGLFKKHLGSLLIFCSIYFVITLSYSSRLFITENIAFSIAMMLFILGMAIYPESLFNNKAVQFLGKISYSFYLLHYFIISAWLKYLPTFMTESSKRFAISFVVITAATTIISFASYKLIEQPFQKLGAHLIRKAEGNDGLKINS